MIDNKMQSFRNRFKSFPFISHTIHGTGIFTYIYHKNQPNVGKYAIHGWSGFVLLLIVLRSTHGMCIHHEAAA